MPRLFKATEVLTRNHRASKPWTGDRSLEPQRFLCKKAEWSFKLSSSMHLVIGFQIPASSDIYECLPRSPHPQTAH
ncbi:hypothetical protein M413DRAFT_440575 [Hebeloma cylindrosporum]|uniref:Uncharacterized protein n=1 Tax=Hebeloma cylindrosporum TaxID=76867 RepID=A0A0C2Z1G9_HEBCY|nr:hypothetical protein M413DRAFT_440575 [Hebeloma cylindrosporum h7]